MTVHTTLRNRGKLLPGSGQASCTASNTSIRPFENSGRVPRHLGGHQICGSHATTGIARTHYDLSLLLSFSSPLCHSAVGHDLRTQENLSSYLLRGCENYLNRDTKRGKRICAFPLHSIADLKLLTFLKTTALQRCKLSMRRGVARLCTG